MQIRSTDKDKPKSIIVDKCSTEEDESELIHKNINKQKSANNKAEYEESIVIDEVLISLIYLNAVGILWTDLT